MQKSNTTSVVIGRFSGFHEGHELLIRRAIEHSDSTIILLGSSNRARSIKNPWTYHERAEYLLKKFKWNTKPLVIAPLNDYLYSDAQWIADVQETVSSMSRMYGLSKEYTLAGYLKDGNEYLKWYPGWEFLGVESDIDMSATKVREYLYKHKPEALPPFIKEEFDQYFAAKETFKSYPYPDSLNVSCADMVVECAGHVLLVKRKHVPGINTWANPGGHKHSNETYLDAAFRELYEETNLRVPEKVLRGSVVSTHLFDHPARSNGGLVRHTLGVHVKIDPNPDGTFPRVSASDDAADARFIKLSAALNDLILYDDHQDIISRLTHTSPKPAWLSKQTFTLNIS